MIPLLVAQPITHKKEIKRRTLQRIVREPVPRLAQRSDGSLSDDEKYISKLLAWFFVLLILPAILALLYIMLNPDAFMNDVTPKYDFSTWQPGQQP